MNVAYNELLARHIAETRDRLDVLERMKGDLISGHADYELAYSRSMDALQEQIDLHTKILHDWEAMETGEGGTPG